MVSKDNLMGSMEEKLIMIISNSSEDRISAESIQDDFDILTSGLFDSMMLIRLMLEIESEFDVEIDFKEFDISEVSTVKAISEYIENLLEKKETVI